MPVNIGENTQAAAAPASHYALQSKHTGYNCFCASRHALKVLPVTTGENTQAAAAPARQQAVNGNTDRLQLLLPVKHASNGNTNRLLLPVKHASNGNTNRLLLPVNMV